ncbi:MAG: acyltransferase [Spirochaetota bacterium]|nr:acyltransferase [Spirochaetota bacterium]
MKKIKNKNNFDLLRLALAVVVYLVHSYGLTNVESLKVFKKYLSTQIAVNSFFVISGFLIFMSYEKSQSLWSYASKRIRRIFPAYVVVIIVCVIVGGIITSYSFKDYLSFDLLRYLLANLASLNFLKPDLPGVFGSNPLSAVNGALWTIKIELMFYVSVPVIVWFLRKWKRFYGLVLLYALSVIYFELTGYLYETTGNDLYKKFSLLLPGSLSFFIAGGILYYYLDKFKERQWLYLAIAVVCYVLYRQFDLYFLMPMSLGVIVVYIAVSFYYLGNFGRLGDFSYGIYIWHFPIIQTLYHFGLYENPLYGFALSLILVLFMAVISWHFVEKVFLGRSSHYIKAEHPASQSDGKVS